MIPAYTYKVLGTSVMQARKNKPDADYTVRGNDLNDLRALAMRLSYKFDDADEQRDWQNRLNLMLDNAQELP